MDKTIFIIEDDSAIADIYKTLMEKSGFKAEVFSLGQEAVKRLKEGEANEGGKPDIILLDLILPDINGMDVLREIKSNEKTKGIKVFILTNQEGVKFEQSDPIRPDKVIIKANVAPTQLIDIIKEELKQ